MPHPPLIDLKSQGIGDVVVAAWLCHSARAANIDIRLNPRRFEDLARRMGLSGEITSDEGDDWSRTREVGLRYENKRAAKPGATRLGLWCDSIGLPRLEPVRPPYEVLADEAQWAERQWGVGESDGRQPRVLVFPDAAWEIRRWPVAYHIDVSNELRRRGWLVGAAAQSRDSVRDLGSVRWWGQSLARVMALAHAADCVIASDSGPAHFSGLVGTHTVAICGPTLGPLVFAHDSCVSTVAIDAETMSCVGCHFQAGRGYRKACDRACQALLRLPPDVVIDHVESLEQVRPQPA